MFVVIKELFVALIGFCWLLHRVECIRSIPGCFRSDNVGVLHVFGHPRAVSGL